MDRKDNIYRIYTVIFAAIILTLLGSIFNIYNIPTKGKIIILVAIISNYIFYFYCRYKHRFLNSRS